MEAIRTLYRCRADSVELAWLSASGRNYRDAYKRRINDRQLILSLIRYDWQPYWAMSKIARDNPASGAIFFLSFLTVEFA